MDHEVDWEPVPEPSASPFVGLDAQGARRLSSLRAPDSSTDTDDPRPGGPASDSSSDIDDGPILARRAERNSVTERRKLTFSAVFDGPQPTTDAAEPQQAYPLPPAAPPPGVVGHTPVPVGGPDHAVVEAALQALHREQETSPGGDGDEQEEAGRGLVYPDRGVEEELEDLRAQVQADAEALDAAQEEKWALAATVQALEAQVAALSSKVQQQQQVQQAAPPVPESETLAALRKDVQELEHLLAASQKENERATLAVKEARQEAAMKVAAAEAEASAVRAELAVIRTETQLAGKPAAAAAAPVAVGAGDGGDAHLPPTAGQLRRILALEAALEQAQEAGAAKERAAAEVEALREQLDAVQRQLASRHSDSSRAHMREAAAARAAAAVARTSMTAVGAVDTAAAAGAGAHVVADAQTQAPPARMNEKLLRQLRAEHEAVRAAYEDRLAVSEAAAAKGVAAAARVRALERELTEARAHASRRVRAVQEEAETAARERDVVVQELDAIRKEAAAAKRREVDILRRERDAKAKCMAAEEAAARAKEDLRDVTHRLQMLETAQDRLQQREEEQPTAEAAPPAAAAPRRSSSAGAARQRAAPPPQAQQQHSRSGSDDVNALQRKLEAAQMSLQAMARSHAEAVEKAAATKLESEKALWQLQTAHAERLDALHKDKLTLEAELKALLSAAGDGSSNPASHDDVRYALAAAARRADAAEQRAAQLEAQLRSSRHMRGGAAHLDGLAARIAAAEAAASKLASRVEAREAECRALIREVARLEALTTGREEHRSGEATLEDVSRALDARKVEVTRFRAALDAVLQGAAARWEPDGAVDSRQGAAA